MKNWEKYEEEIKAVDYNLAVVNGKATRCRDTACSDCKFDHDGKDCDAKRMKWLYEEADEGIQLIDTAKEYTMGDLVERINEIVDAVNELKGEQK